MKLTIPTGTLTYILIIGSFILGAGLEVAGDGFIRQGLESRSGVRVMLGLFLLSLYGLAINFFLVGSGLGWSFSKQLGTYVALFALVTIIWGQFTFDDEMSIKYLLGVALIVVGGIIVATS